VVLCSSSGFGLDTGRRVGPEPAAINLETYGVPIPEA
jgi:hypothetical protein